MIKFISDNDFGNLGYAYAESLKAIGHRAESYCLFKHPYGYAKQSKRIYEGEVRESLHGADVVIIMHSSARFVQYVPEGVPYFVMHGGTRYRQNTDDFIKKFKDARGAIIQTPDLLGLGTIPEELICAPADLSIEYVPFHKTLHGFGHYPTNRMNKGTDQIIRAARQSRIDLHTDEMLLPYYRNLERIGKCKIYIELFKPEQRGKLYGTFGLTAIEAAMVGRPVITQCANYQSYVDRYCDIAFEIVESESELIEAMTDCAKMTDDSVERWGKNLRNDVMKWHSPQRIGEQLIEFINFNR
jgi:glycosyltransferase involved in cell wall biosynthesis